MKLNELKPPQGARHSRKRLGCGTGSGHGKTAGKGHKGQKARAGGFVRPGFEGGQTPLYRRLPRRGFNNKNFATVYEIVNVADLAAFNAGAAVTPAELKKAGLVSGRRGACIKVLGDGELAAALTVSAHKFSQSAQEKIAKAGGSCVVIETVKPAAESR